MPPISFRTRQGVAKVPRHALTQRIIPSLMGFRRKTVTSLRLRFDSAHRPRSTTTVCQKSLTRRHLRYARGIRCQRRRQAANDNGHDLTRPTAQDGPQPALPDPFAHKRPDLIHLQPVIGLRWSKHRPERRQRLKFFFDPICQGVPRDAEDAADPSQTGPFLIRSEDFFLAFRAIILFRGQDPNGAAVFAEILLTTALISSVFDDI
jgi:hypothetical protein